jgi:3-phenylpropionate/trans-cinnamate dioxygenase ferredoxin reductase component
LNNIVVVGGGHAGVQLCSALAAAGQGARVHLVCEEPVLPYQRPPLSKSYLKSADEALLFHRSDAWFAERGITLQRDGPARSIDRVNKTITLANGAVLGYEWLVLATGTRARQLPQLPADLANVHVLRTAADAQRLRAALTTRSKLTVLGGGFIGLEVAATARAMGMAVRVLESAPRLLLRSVSPDIAANVLQVHRASGIEVQTHAVVSHFKTHGDRLVSLDVNGQQHVVDALLLGIGAVPEVSLASEAGLVCDNGIVVDEHMRTSDDAVLAIGDCANFPEPGSGRRLRLESVQNANDQAKAAASTLLGAPQAYRALPWFWSEQGSIRLQMAGLMPAGAHSFRRPGANAASFSILNYAAGKLLCVESVNAPADHLAARKLLEAGISPEPVQACDPARPLKSFM